LKKIRASIDTHLALRIDDLGKGTVAALKQEYTHSNPKFWKAKRLGYWAGDIPREIFSYEVDEDWLLLPRGAISKIRDFLSARGMIMEPLRDHMSALEPLDLKLKGNLYPYQEKASQALVNAANATIRGPCASGKTVILLATIAKLAQPALIIVHSEILMRQWKSFIIEWFGFVPGSIGGKEAENIRPITVGMQQSIRNRAGAPWINDFGTLVGDEIHRWAAPTFQAVARMFPAKYRIGASADERRKDGQQYLIYEMFGDCAHKITREELLELDRLIPVCMQVIPTQFADDDYITAVLGNELPDWVNMITRLTEDKDRNKIIFDSVNHVLQENRNNRILILTERTEAVFNWQRVLESAKIKTGAMVGGKDNRDAVEDAIRKMKSGKLRVSVGTSVADEGLDIPQLTHVFVTCPMHTNLKRLNQMGGRTGRKWKSKKQGTIYYFWDRLMFPAPSVEDTTKKRKIKELAFLRKLNKIAKIQSDISRYPREK